MKRIVLAVRPVLVLLVCTLGLVAQEAAVTHAPDGRAPQFVMALIFPPKPGAPFMANARMVAVQILPDKSTVTMHSERAVARDNDGRIFEERRQFMPGSGPEASRLLAVDYMDPQAHTQHRCFPGPNYCAIYDYFFGTPRMMPVGLQADKTTYLTREQFGTETVAGVEAQHSRETFTLYMESVGNSRTILRIVDYWYSPELGINVQVKRHDPRDGDQTLWLTDLTQSAPDPATFNLPEGYRMVDLTHTGAAPGPVITRWRPPAKTLTPAPTQ